MAALATSQPFVEALRRDVHILVDAFALTWMWLDNQPSDSATSTSPVSLRWEYGAMAVFERVWVRNHWNHVNAVLGRGPATRATFSDMIVRAFVDELALVAEPGMRDASTILHAVAAIFALYFWSQSLPPCADDQMDIDKGMYNATYIAAAYDILLQLPEWSRPVLDGPVTTPPPGMAPPSADVWFVTQQLIGSPMTPGLLRVTLGPIRVPRLFATTALMPRHASAHTVRTQGTVGLASPLVPMPDPAPPRDARQTIVETLGIPTSSPPLSDGLSTRTAAALDALRQTHAKHAQAQRHMDEAMAWGPELWDAQRPSSTVSHLLEYLRHVDT